MHATSKSRQLHSISRLKKQKREIDDILWKVTKGGAGMSNFHNEDLNMVQIHDVDDRDSSPELPDLRLDESSIKI